MIEIFLTGTGTQTEPHNTQQQQNDNQWNDMKLFFDVLRVVLYV